MCLLLLIQSGGRSPPKPRVLGPWPPYRPWRCPQDAALGHWKPMEDVNLGDCSIRKTAARECLSELHISGGAVVMSKV
jgi:hypothetical protein